MKILKTNDFISERIKVKPITNAEWDRAKTDIHKSMRKARRSLIKTDIDDPYTFLNGYLDKEFLDKFDSIRLLKSNNIELVADYATYRDRKNTHIFGLKCVLYINGSEICWRRWKPDNKYYPMYSDDPWENRSTRTGPFDSIDLMVDSFKQWVEKHITFK